MIKKSGLATVFLVVLIDLIGFGIVLPHLAFYATEFRASSFMVGFLYSIYSMAQLVFSPLWGSLSDRIGRRPVMLSSTLGAAAAYLLFAFSRSLAMLFVSRLLAGVMAGNISAAQAYVSDVTTAEDRAKGMGLIGAAFGIGFVLGPAIGAMLVQTSLTHGASNPYAMLGFFAAGLSLCSFLMVLFKLPESLSAAPTAGFSLVRAALARNARGSRGAEMRSWVFSPAFWKVLSFPRALSLFLISIFLLSFGQSSLYGAFPLFCKSQLGLSPAQVGLQYVYMGLIAVLIQGGLIRVLVKRVKEQKLFLIGNFLFVAGLAAIPFAKNAAMLTLFLGLMAVGASLNGPTLNSLISKQAPENRTGAVLGASQGLAALGRAVGPAWGGLLYGFSFRAPFALTAMIAAFTIFIGLRIEISHVRAG